MQAYNNVFISSFTSHIARHSFLFAIDAFANIAAQIIKENTSTRTVHILIHPYTLKQAETTNGVHLLSYLAVYVTKWL